MILAMEVGSVSHDDGRNARRTTTEHTIQMTNRESVLIRGVLHVDSFDNQEVILSTELGTLTMKGKDLRIKQLDLDEGSFAVEGFISSFSYSEGSVERQKNKNLLGRILR